MATNAKLDGADECNLKPWVLINSGITDIPSHFRELEHKCLLNCHTFVLEWEGCHFSIETNVPIELGCKPPAFVYVGL